MIRNLPYIGWYLSELRHSLGPISRAGRAKLKIKVGASMIVTCADFKNKTDIEDNSTTFKVHP